MVAEKLLNFADAAGRYPQFRRELARFVSRVREMFTPLETHTHITRLERDRSDIGADIEDDRLIREGSATATERPRQFAPIKELLTRVGARSIVNWRRGGGLVELAGEFRR